MNFNSQELTDISKGVMLSHDNVSVVCVNLYNSYNPVFRLPGLLRHWLKHRVAKNRLEFGGKEQSISYLPLVHISGMVRNKNQCYQCNDKCLTTGSCVYLPILLGSTVYFAQPDSLKV